MENVQVYVALAIIGVTIILFATEAFKTSITAILSSLAMVLVGINTPKNLTSGFSNSAMRFCFGIAVVGTALSETGCLSYLSKRIMFISRFSERTVLVIILAATAAFSMFLSNTSIVIIFMSIAAILAKTSNGRFKVKNFYMGIGIAAVAGGSCTLVGSTVQLSVNAALPEFGVEPFKMWDFLGPGVPMIILMLLWYYFIGYKIQQKSFDFPDPDEELVQTNAAELQEGNPRSIRMWIPLVTLIICIALTLYGWDMALCGLLGAMIVCVCRCISVKRMWATTDWNTLFTIAGAVGFAAGIDNSGAGVFIAEKCIDIFGRESSPWLYLAIFVFLAAIMTNVMLNMSAALILIPIAVSIAQVLNFNAATIVMGIIMGANMPFSTPIGANPITMTLQGGYRFKDYTRVNLGLNILAAISVVIATPVFFPF